MRIGMVLDFNFPPDPRVENEAVSLIQAGHEVHLFSVSYQNLPLYEVINGLKVHRYPAGKLIHKLSALAYTVSFYHQWVKPRLRDFQQKTQIEAWHVHDMLIAQAVFEVNKNLGLPLVLDLHENRPAIMAYYGFVRKFPGKYLIQLNVWERKQREFMRKAQRVVLVTEQAKAQALKDTPVSPEKVVVVPNVITPNIFYNYPEEPAILHKFRSGFNVLYLGDTGLRRGTDTAIRAVAALRGGIPEIQLILVGKSKQDPLLHQLARDLGVEQHVFFEGWQLVSYFPSYIKASHLCLSPLVRNLHHDTTYANKIFQYMAGGRAQVVSDCPAQAVVVEQERCGLVHRAGDADDLARKILDLYQNPGLREEMGTNGKWAVEKTYNWPAQSQALLQLYRELQKA